MLCLIHIFKLGRIVKYYKGYKVRMCGFVYLAPKGISSLMLTAYLLLPIE